MKFSDEFEITIIPEDDWFDPILSFDTRLFIDPFLLYAGEQGHFIGSHDEVIAFFNSAFQLIARSRGNQSSVLWKKAVNMLQLGEVEEICLGYTGSGTGGAGSGDGIAKTVARALWEAIQAGLIEITHFEEILILGLGIGADRLSDAVASIIRHRLASYTNEICVRHKIPMRSIRYIRGIYNLEEENWLPLGIRLPINPYNSKPILLVPAQYLRTLPTINADDFWDFCFDNENETIRNEFSYDVSRRVPKHQIVAFARRHPNIRRNYLANREKSSSQPYDFNRDPKGLIQWYEATSEFVKNNPMSISIDSMQAFRSVIDDLLKQFKHFIEENRGWNLLWNDDGTARKESAAQDLFLGIVKHYCKANNIDVSRESNIGRGPVDFKTSQGYSLRALIEVKLAKNTKFWHGLETQLPKYQDAEDVRLGYFLVIAYTRKDLQRIWDIQERVRFVNSNTGYQITAVVVDAKRKPLSASRL